MDARDTLHLMRAIGPRLRQGRIRHPRLDESLLSDDLAAGLHDSLNRRQSHHAGISAVDFQCRDAANQPGTSPAAHGHVIEPHQHRVRRRVVPTGGEIHRVDLLKRDCDFHKSEYSRRGKV